MPKKKLLVLLGAGSSIEQGMPSVPDINRLMQDWASECADNWEGISSFHGGIYLIRTGNYYRALTDLIDYYSVQAQWQPNFEKILGEMASLAHWVAPPGQGNPLRGIIGDVSDRYIQFEVSNPPSYQFSLEHGEDAARNLAINKQLVFLLARLAVEIRSRSRAIDHNTAAFHNYRQLMSALRNEFDVGIYNLNYDTVALACWPGAFTGFNSAGLFDATGVHKRAHWGFNYHVHGSVHHTLNTEEGPISWQPDLGATFNDGLNLRLDTRTDGKYLPVTTLIAGGAKLDQMLNEPFNSLYTNLPRHVYEADAILVGGYGFSDTHINRALQNRLYYLRPDDRPPIIVLTLSSPSDRLISTRNDNWGWNLRVCLLGDAGPVSWQPMQEQTLASLLSDRQFEFVSEKRCAIWHGGFTSCVTRLDRVIAWLDGGREAFH